MDVRLEKLLKWCKKEIFSLTLSVIFLFCVGVGFTGSSLGFYKQLPGSSDLISLTGERKLFGVYRGIRGDEFIAHGTATAMQQFHHSPAFPRINENCGVEGRCYLALHDLGAPVFHFSMLGRPAVWGFFFLDLRRALSWYWFLPLFLGIWGAKFFLDSVFPGQEKINILLSLSLTLSAYAGAWSFWPVNNIYGILIAGGIFFKILDEPGARKKALLAVLAAWMLYCSFMSLYMPRVIPFVGLMLAVVIGRCQDEKLWKKVVSVPDILCWTAVFLISAGLIALWYCDAAMAVERIAASAYPGMRRECGGGLPWWMSLAGHLSWLTVYKTTFMNQSELQGFFNILPVLAAWCIVNRRRLKAVWTWRMLWIFTLMISVYQFFGFPAWLAEITLWSRCTPIRMQWVLNMVQMVMIALIFREKSQQEWKNAPVWSWLSATVMTGFIALSLVFMPSGLTGGFKQFLPGIVVTAMLIFVVLLAGVSGWLLWKNIPVFVVFYMLVNTLPGVIFNPLCVAPEKIENRLFAAGDAGQMRYGGRVLFATGNDFLAVCYSLCGGRVFNSYFMYYDAKIDELFFQGMPGREKFHRMSHFDISLTDEKAPLVTATIPFPDRIAVGLNGRNFDFSALPVDVVALFKSDRQMVSGNRSLQYWKSGENLCFYKVIAPSEE